MAIHVFAFLGCAQATEDISIINLIATPDRYQGREVSVAGYAIFGLEVNALYLAKSDVDHGMTKNSICLSGAYEYFELKRKDNSLSLDEIRQMNKSYVLVTGTFDSNNRGHAGMHSGCLTKITKITILPGME